MLRYRNHQTFGYTQSRAMVNLGEFACLDMVKNPDAPAATRLIEG
jgi:hypothetical protein